MLTARRIVDQFQACGITHVVGLPDNTTAALFNALATDGAIPLITVTREGEAFATAAGLWIGGQTPLVLIQNTGFLESGDALRGTLTRMRIPVVCLISYRGFNTLPGPAPDSFSFDELTRQELDSAAVLLEPTLRAWALPYELLTDDRDLNRLPAALERARQERRPVALIIPQVIR